MIENSWTGSLAAPAHPRWTSTGTATPGVQFTLEVQGLLNPSRRPCAAAAAAARWDVGYRLLAASLSQAALLALTKVLRP